MTPFGAIPLVESQYAMVRRWVFPRDRFIEYESKDEPWCRSLGIGHEVTEPGAYLIGGQLMVHPDIAARIRNPQTGEEPT